MRHLARNGNCFLPHAHLLSQVRLPGSFILFLLCLGPDPGFPQSITNTRPELILQTGHSEPVRDMAFSPDGRWLASTIGDDTVKLWELTTGFEFRTLSGLVDHVTHVAFSPDGCCLATVSWDSEVLTEMVSTVKLWDVMSGRELQTLAYRTSVVNAVTFSPDGKWLATGGDETVMLWDVTTGRQVRNLTSNASVGALAFSHDGSVIASGTKCFTPANGCNTITLWDVSTGRELGKLKGHSDGVNAMAFSPNGRWLASASKDKTARLWDVSTGRELQILPGHSGPLDVTQAVEFNMNGDLVASADTDNTVRVWQTATGHELRRFNGPASVASVAFSPRTQYFASGDWYGTISIRDVSTGRELHKLLGQSDLVRKVAMSPDRRWIVSGSRDDTVSVWETETGRTVRTLGKGTVPAGAIAALAFSSDGRVLASTDGDKVVLSEVKTWRTLRSLGDKPSIRLSSGVEVGDTVLCVAFSPDGHWLATGGLSVKIWDVATGRKVRTLRGHLDSVQGIAFSPDGRWLASGDSRGMVRVWRVKTGRARRTLHGSSNNSYKDWVNGLAFSPDGHTLALATEGGDVTLWDIDSNGLRTLSGHTAVVNAVAFSPDGHRLASASDDNTVKLWDLATGQELRTLAGHTSGVAAVTFSGDGRWLVSGSSDSSTRVWNPETGDQLITLVTLHHGRDWLTVAPDGLFDGTADAMQEIAWRNTNGGAAVVPLDSFFTDFFHPGLLAEVMAGEQPKAQVDLATVLQIPGLRTMLAQKQAHLETREGQALVCFEQAPSVAVGSTPGETDLPTETNGFRVVPDEATCKYQKELPSEGNASDVVTRLQNWKPEVFKTPWDGKPSDTTNSTLHTLTVGVGQYPTSSGFDALPYAAKSAKAVEDFFTEQKSSDMKPYAQIRVWPGLYDLSATRDAVRGKLSEMAKAMGEDDVVLLYLAGHGAVTPGQEMFYFVPVDGRDTQIRDTGLNTAMLAEVLRDMPARRVVLVIDACQSGGAVEALSKIGEVKARVEERRGQQEGGQKAGHEHGVGVHVIAATLPLAYAVQLRKEDQSALAVTLLEGLRQTKGPKGISEVIEYLKQRLPEASERAVGYRQVPLISSVGLDFKLAAR